VEHLLFSLDLPPATIFIIDPSHHIKQQFRRPKKKGKKKKKTMLRVSSRQRLVSWDAFDASMPDDDLREDQLQQQHQPIPMSADSSNITMASDAVSDDDDDSDAIIVDNDNDNDEFYSVAGYDQASTATCTNGKASMTVSASASWSFDQTTDAPHPPQPPFSPISPTSAGRKRDREPVAPSILMPALTTSAAAVAACSPRFVSGSNGSGGSAGSCSAVMRKTVSFSTLPQFPSLIEEEPPRARLSVTTEAIGSKHGSSSIKPTGSSGMPRTPSLLDLLSKPSPAPVSRPTNAMVASDGSSNKKTLIIPRVPSTVGGLGSRVQSDCSLSSTLSRYMSVPSNLCDIDDVMPTSAAAGSSIGAEHLNRTVPPAAAAAAAATSNVSTTTVPTDDDNEAVSDLPGDALSSVASYLNTTDLRQLSTTNGDLRHHFSGSAGEHLWVDHAARLWPQVLRPDANPGLEGRVVEIVDRVGIVTAGVGGGGGSTTSSRMSPHQQQQPNLSVLVGLAASNCPTSMSPCPMPSAAEVPGRQRRIRSGEQFGDVRIRHDVATSGRTGTAIQFNGRVGEGDRSITSDAPLPRPLPPVRSGEMGVAGGRTNDDKESGGSSGGSNRAHRWSPRLPPIGPLPTISSPTQALVTLLRSASRSSSRGDSDDDGDDTAGRSTPRAGGKGQKLRPFVCPYVASEDEDKTVIDMTPRLVAYYEVKILPRDAIVQEQTNELERDAARARARPFPPARMVLLQRLRALPHAPGEGPEMPPLRLPGPALGGPAGHHGAFPLPRHLPQPRHAGVGTIAADADQDDAPPSDCVAIGLSTSRFRPAAKMPGWDVHSYGYHSDDGGIFHGAGDMERVYGTTYGVGDTVGCGIDYSHGNGGAIFFTLNGKFLGYAWTDVSAIAMGDDLYPTVGVDTNCPLDINLGTRPFDFDLGGFMQGQQKQVVDALGPLVAANKSEVKEADGSDIDRRVDLKKTHEWGKGVADFNVNVSPFSRGVVDFGSVKRASNARSSSAGSNGHGRVRRSRVFRS